VLLLISPLLEQYPKLSTTFVSALIRVDEQVRVELLFPSKKIPKVSWDAPFLFEVDRKQLLESCSTFHLSMGLYNVIKNNKRPLDIVSLQILFATLQGECQKKIQKQTYLDTNTADIVFHHFYGYIIASFAVAETFAIGWDVFTCFMRLCSTDIVLHVFFDSCSDLL
jgi:hypothetical protein